MVSTYNLQMVLLEDSYRFLVLLFKKISEYLQNVFTKNPAICNFLPVFLIRIQQNHRLNLPCEIVCFCMEANTNISIKSYRRKKRAENCYILCPDGGSFSTLFVMTLQKNYGGSMDSYVSPYQFDVWQLPLLS